MIAEFMPCTLAGDISAPPSKSMAHRYLIGAALSGQVCTLTGVDFSQDILASMDCLRALGAKVYADGDAVTVDPAGFMQADGPVLECRESGSTLRFFIPLALFLGQPVTLRGSARLMERPLSVYEELCREKGFVFEKSGDSITVCGRLTSGAYTLRGDISSQFITGLIFALVHLNGEASIRILPPFESRSYIDLTLSALRAFGADVAFADDHNIIIKPSTLHAYCGRIEGDWSNAAFLDAFNLMGGDVNEKTGRISLTLMEKIDKNSKLMSEEIFGPILPVYEFNDINIVINTIRKRPKPLALYLFTKNKAVRKSVLENLDFGGGCVNDTVLQLANPHLPFGGVGESGHGRYHGKAGFDTFSAESSVLLASPGCDLNPFRYPPYDDNYSLLKFLLRHFT